MISPLAIVVVVLAVVVGFVLVGVVAYVRSLAKTERATERRFTELEVQVALLTQQVKHLQENLVRTEAERDECRAETRKLQSTNGKLAAELAAATATARADNPPAPAKRSPSASRQRISLARRLETTRANLAILEEQIAAAGGPSLAPAPSVLQRDSLKAEIIELEHQLDALQK